MEKPPTSGTERAQALLERFSTLDTKWQALEENTDDSDIIYPFLGELFSQFRNQATISYLHMILVSALSNPSPPPLPQRTRKATTLRATPPHPRSPRRLAPPRRKTPISTATTPTRTTLLPPSPATSSNLS